MINNKLTGERLAQYANDPLMCISDEVREMAIELQERRKAGTTPEFYTEAARFLPECLKPEEISGERRNTGIAELMGWFDRYYNGNANPKWFKSHAAELCYYILTATPVLVVPDEKPMPEASKMHAIDAVAAIAEVRGWNACRAAMLHDAEPVSQHYMLPMQPLVIDVQGTLRFKENSIVRKLLDYSTERGYGLNEMALERFDAEDHMQLAQLIGYSLAGYGELSYVTDESYSRAAAAAPQREVK